MFETYFLCFQIWFKKKTIICSVLFVVIPHICIIIFKTTEKNLKMFSENILFFLFKNKKIVMCFPVFFFFWRIENIFKNNYQTGPDFVGFSCSFICYLEDSTTSSCRES